MGAVVTALGTMGAVVALGWFLARRRVLGERAAPVLARVVFAVATPALLLTTVAHADLHLLLSRQAVVTWTSTVVVALVAVLVLRFALRRPAADVTVGTLASSYVNAGNVGLPLAVYLLDDAVAVVPDAAVPAPRPGADRLRGARPRLPGRVRAATDPEQPDHRRRRSSASSWPRCRGRCPRSSTSRSAWSVPRPRRSRCSRSACRSPCRGRSTPRHRAPTSTLAVSLRAVVHPLLAWGLGTALGLPPHALLAVVAMAALPTAQNVLVYAMQYRHGEALARDAGLVTTVLCVPVLLVVAATLG